MLEKSRHKPNLHNRVDPLVEQAVLKHALEEPAQVEPTEEFKKKEKAHFEQFKKDKKAPALFAASREMFPATH